MLNRFIKAIIWIISAIILWGLFFILLKSKSIAANEAVLWAFFYSLSVFILQIILNKVVLPKLSAFSVKVQITLKSLLYITGFLAAVTAVFAIFTFYSLSRDFVLGELILNTWRLFTILVVKPVSGNYIAELIPQEFLYGFYSLLLILAVLGVLSVIVSYIETRWVQTNSVLKINEAQIKMLHTQIQPHFLFNTINTIASLIKTDAQKAEELLLKFADFYRYNFSNFSQNKVELENELKFLDTYLNLLKARFGDLLNWSFNCDNGLRRIMIPVMILQPIVENAVRHGWQEKQAAFFLELICTKISKRLIIKIIDNGTGVDIKKYRHFPPPGSGLYNVKQRLELMYMKSNLLMFESGPGKGTTVSVTIPDAL